MTSDPDADAAVTPPAGDAPEASSRRFGEWPLAVVMAVVLAGAVAFLVARRRHVREQVVQDAPDEPADVPSGP